MIDALKNDENTANERTLAINSDARRALIALDATYEIESLATFICERVNAYHDEHELSSDQFMVKGLAMRIKQLNGVIMGAISDDCATITSLKKQIGLIEFSLTTPSTAMRNAGNLHPLGVVSLLRAALEGVFVDNSEKQHMSLGEVVKRMRDGTLPQEHLDLLQSETNKIKNHIEMVKTHALSHLDSINSQIKNATAGILKAALPIVTDMARARELISLYDENGENSLSVLFENIQRNLDKRGQLTSQQITWLILEAKGIDTSKLIEADSKRLQGLAVAREASAKNKSERSEEYRAKWNEWAGETLKANPAWDLDKIADHVCEVAKNYNHKMSNGKTYAVSTIKKAIKGFKKNMQK